MVTWMYMVYLLLSLFNMYVHVKLQYTTSADVYYVVGITKHVSQKSTISLSFNDFTIFLIQFISSANGKRHIKALKSNYSWLSLSRTRLSRITAYLEVKIWSLPKHENLTSGKKYCGKEEKLLLRSNFSSFPQYFQYISNFRRQITHIFVKCG